MSTRAGRGLLAVAAGGVLLVVAGLVISVSAADRGTPGPTGGASTPVPTTAPAPTDRASRGPGSGAGAQTGADDVRADRAAQDAIADAPMPTLPLTAALPQPVTTRDPGAPIVLPVCTEIGPVEVPTGCPQTPEGAMAQLVTINQTAMQSGTMLGVRQVVEEWALPGGPTRTSWSAVAAMARLLNGETGTTVPIVLSPRTGLFKGQVEDDFVVPCVQYELTLTVVRTARVAVADCQRMVWDGRRWQLGPGPEPVQAPNVWPGTDASIDLGFRDLTWQP